MARSSTSPFLLQWQRAGAVVAVAAMLTSSAQALGFSCDQVVASDVVFNLKPLGGVHTVASPVLEQTPKQYNWTFTLNLCNALERVGKNDCPTGTRVCGKQWMWEGDEQAELAHVVAVTGEFTTNAGRPLEVEASRIKHSASNSDLDKEGVRLEMKGGRDPFTPKNGQKGVKQKAIIELLCNRDKTGWEPDKDPAEQKKLYKKDDGNDENHDDDDDDDDGERENDDNGGSGTNGEAAIQFINYDRETINSENWDVLRLKWETKWACEDAAQYLPPTEGWGFFTWLIILLFLGIAAYVIFGSWMNYNRFGVTGFDAVPHADSLRDIPYLLRDIFRRFQSGGSRGGYSAV